MSSPLAVWQLQWEQQRSNHETLCEVYTSLSLVSNSAMLKLLKEIGLISVIASR